MTHRLLPAAAALLILSLTACGSGRGTTAAAPSPTSGDSGMTVTASTTHDEGAVLTWDGREQEIADGEEFTVSFETPPPSGMVFFLRASGEPQASAVTCTITVDGVRVAREHRTGPLPETSCARPAEG